MGNITHTKVSAIADGTDETLVRPSDWNAEHEVSTPADDADVTTKEYVDDGLSTHEAEVATASVAGHATAAQITKLDGIAALADVTGDNSPQVHGATRHTDIARELFIAPSPYTTGTWGEHHYTPAVLCDPAAASNIAYHGFNVPNDFVSFTSVKVIWAGKAGVAGQDVRISTSSRWKAASEGLNTHNETPADQTLDCAALDTRYDSNLNYAMATLAKGDNVGMWVKRLGSHALDTLTGDMCIYGLLFTYVAEQ